MKPTYIGYGEIPDIPCPEEKPEDAEFVFYQEWSWSPAHSRSDSYSLSKNDAGTYWILWDGWYDEGEGEVREEPRVYVPISTDDEQTVAKEMMRAMWLSERAIWESSLRNPPMGYTPGLLGESDFAELRKEIWPEAD